MSEFLFEIGLEEIPARMIAGAQAQLKRRTVALLERERLAAPEVAVKSFSTPRRLAVWVAEVAERQADATEELLGPALTIAYKDGIPSKAALAFAKKAGVPVEDLKTITTPKGEYLQAVSLTPGRPAAEVLGATLPKELAGIYWAKNMYWRAGRPEHFVRPVRWLLALLGAEIIPVEFASYTASRQTFGHRVLHGPAPLTIANPGDYETALHAAFVQPNVEARRHTIRKSLDRVCRTLPGTRWREDHALVEKLTHLTEWPTVIAGSFEPEYLTLPEEVLVTVMRDHQSYFAVEDPRGKVAPHFLAVLNTQADATGEATIRHGNERVLRARFNDARFFWDFDQRTRLTDRVTLLENVTFQKDLGSYAAKTERVRALAARLATLLTQRGTSIDAAALDEAARLAKTDLTCELVKEFTELQGIVGGLYASAQGSPAAVGNAIYDHYLPGSMDDRVPRTTEGALLAIADKLDTIAGMFSLGLEPTGSKDPFALRRAANGIVKILAEKPLPLTLNDLLDAAPEAATHLAPFFAERLDFYLREVRGQAYDVVKAVVAAESGNVRSAVARASALTAVRGSADFLAVSAAFKRMTNILLQGLAETATATGQTGILFRNSPLPRVNPALLVDSAEQSLWHHSRAVAGRVAALAAEARYEAALIEIATLRPQVDAFFVAVMVMDPDPALRANRLALLGHVLADFSTIADFSEIITQG